NFSEECEVDFTQPSYQGARDAYSEFSGPNGFIDKTIKSFEDFDEQACDAVNRSGIAAYIYDYQQAISQTSYNLLGIKIETPKMDDTYLSTITNGAAIGVKAVVANVQNGENSNTTNLSILNSSKVDKWLSPDYKLTPDEIKEARELARKELDGVERIKGTHQPIFNNKTEEENYKKALALMNKCSGVASYCQGFMSLIGNIATVPQNIVEDIIVGGFGEIGATMVDNTFGTDLSSDVRNLREQMQNSISQQEADLKLAKQNARTQHPDAFMAGDTTFKAIMYFDTEGLFSAAAEGLEISKFAAVQIAENAQDLMLDTTSVYNELIEDGNLSDSDWAALGSNVLLNAMNNLAFSQLNELVDICNLRSRKIIPRLWYK
ncbi:hypothetical protein, partial [Butyrivibrio sp. INlla21]|uniref:hypothetical protein n=1 Tax=Butyrivibrio sp. INlla21 TaxID=1520811 RepID=UPI0008E87670